MEKNTAVQLTQRWWTENKAATLADKAKLGPALGTFEKALKTAAVAKGMIGLQQVVALKRAIEAVETARKKTVLQCGRLHAETRWVLERQFVDALDKARQKTAKLLHAIEDPFERYTLDDVLKDRTLRTLWLQYADRPTNVPELAEYVKDILLGKKYGAASQAKFLVKGAVFQQNIEFRHFADFQKAVEAGADPADPDLWKTPNAQVTSLIQMDGHVTSKFLDWIWQQTGVDRAKVFED